MEEHDELVDILAWIEAIPTLDVLLARLDQRCAQIVTLEEISALVKAAAHQPTLAATPGA